MECIRALAKSTTLSLIHIWSERSIEETKELLENQFQDLVFQAQNLALKRPDLATLSLDKIKTKYTDYNSAMEDLLKKSKSYFPAIQDLTYEAVSYTHLDVYKRQV